MQSAYPPLHSLVESRQQRCLLSEVWSERQGMRDDLIVCQWALLWRVSIKARAYRWLAARWRWWHVPQLTRVKGEHLYLSPQRPLIVKLTSCSHKISSVCTLPGSRSGEMEQKETRKAALASRRKTQICARGHAGATHTSTCTLAQHCTLTQQLGDIHHIQEMSDLSSDMLNDAERCSVLHRILEVHQT